MEAWTGGWTYRWIDKQMDGQIYIINIYMAYEVSIHCTHI